MSDDVDSIQVRCVFDSEHLLRQSECSDLMHPEDVSISRLENDASEVQALHYHEKSAVSYSWRLTTNTDESENASMLDLIVVGLWKI